MSEEQKIKDLEHQISVLEQRLALYENDPSKRGYFSLVSIVNQQIDILHGFSLQSEIKNNPKDDKQYDRVKAIWEGLKTMLIDLKALKLELRISPEEEKESMKNGSRMNPEGIANLVGDNREQHV